jgi:hypothetical protein
MKRTILFIALGIVLLGTGVGIYFYFFSSKPSLTGQTGALLPSSDSAGGDTSGQGGVAQQLGVPVAGAGTEVAPRLIRISDRPVVFGSVATYVPGVQVPKTGTTTDGTTAYSTDPDVRISYLDRESGNVFAFTAHARTLTRISNKTLPAIQSAAWTPDGSLAFVQYLEKNTSGEQISTYALPSNGEGGYMLEKNISEVAVTGSSTLVTLAPSSNGSIASISSTAGSGVRTLFSSLLGSLRLTSSNGITVATTKASSKSSGYAFLVSSKDGSFTRILGPLSGLTTLLSPSGKYLLYSYLEKGRVVLAVFDMTAHTATRLPLSTLPEKCAWTADSLSLYCGVPTSLSPGMPDDWYQGVIATTDRIWQVDLQSRVATQVVDLQTVGAGAVDAVSLDVDTTSDILIFTNRSDGSLWMYDL